MKAPRNPSSADRASILDVFENFLGDTISGLNRSSIQKLSNEARGDLAELIDVYLTSATQDNFHENAVVLDGFSSPIILPDDDAVPHTVRRAKQVALSHTEVIFPLEEFALRDPVGLANRLSSFLIWTKTNSVLLRSHVFSLTATPSPLEIIDVEAFSDLLDRLHSGDVLEGLNFELSQLQENGGVTAATLDCHGLLAAALQDSAAAAVFDTDLSFLHLPSGAMFRALANRMASEKNSMGPSHASILETISLPAIDDVSDDDFVHIRQDAEQFDTYRSVLSRSLDNTAKQVASGTSVSQAFTQNLDEVRWRAELLREDLRDSSLSQHLGKSAQAVSLGALTTGAAATAAALPISPDATPFIAAQVGSVAAITTLHALLTYNRRGRDRRLLRFYDVLLDDQQST